MAKFNLQKERKKTNNSKIVIFKKVDEIKDDFKNANKWFDLLISNGKYLKITSFIVSVVLIGGFYANANVFAQDQNAKQISDQPVVVKYNSEKYVLEGAPESCKVSLVGSDYAIEQTLNNDEFQIVIDMNNAIPGEQDVQLQAEGVASDVQVNIEPKIVTVNLQEKSTEQFPITVEYTNMHTLDQELSLTPPVLSTNTAQVSGTADEINNVASVQAVVDVSGVTDVLDQEAYLYAYDSNGNKLNVEITPATVNVKAEVKRTYKEVAINPIINGTPANDLAVASVTTTPSTVTIYGPEDVLADINKVDVVIDVNKAKASFSKDYELVLPNDVRKVAPSTVKVDVNLDTKVTKTIRDVNIQFKNLGQNLQATATNSAYAKVDVQVTGAASVVDALDATDIEAYVDLKGLTQGTYKLNVQFGQMPNVEIKVAPDEKDLIKGEQVEIKIT